MPVLVLLALLGLLGLGLAAVHRGLAVGDGPQRVLAWNAGEPPAQHALSRFHVRWYTASVVFLAFDVEMLFMYPWALVVADLGPGAVVEMFLFLGMLLLAVLWAHREGAFRWV